MGKNVLQRNLSAIDDAYREKGLRILDGDADANTGIPVVLKWIMLPLLVCVASGGSALGLMLQVSNTNLAFIGTLMAITCSTVGLFAIIWYCDGGFHRYYACKALDAWNNGAYRDSKWYQGMSDDEKAHVIGMHDSKAYRTLNGKVHDLTVRGYDMGPALRVLDNAIDGDTVILNGGLASENGIGSLNNLIEQYESYRAAFKSDSRTKTLTVIEKDSTDLSDDDEKELIQAINAYNDEVRRTALHARHINEYMGMMQKYRDALIHNPGYNHGTPSNKAVRDAENLAYAGFTM